MSSQHKVTAGGASDEHLLDDKQRETRTFIACQHHGTDLAALLHRGEHVVRARKRLRDLIRDLLAEGAATGTLRDDVAPGELARYCLHALEAASSLQSKAAVRRLVIVTLAGLEPPGAVTTSRKARQTRRKA